MIQNGLRDITETQSPVSGDLVEILYVVSITPITRDKLEQYSLGADKKLIMQKKDSAKYKQERWKTHDGSAFIPTMQPM